MAYKPFPEFQRIGIKELRKMPMSIILQAGSNWLTQWGEHKMGWPYDVTFTHAMIYIANDDVLSMGLNAKVFTIQELYKKSHKWIVIRISDMSEGVRSNAIQIAYNRAASNEYQFKRYDIMGYAGFMTRVFPPLQKIPWLKGSDKYEFCSDQAVNVIKEAGHPPFQPLVGNKISPCQIFTCLSVLASSVFYELVIE